MTDYAIATTLRDTFNATNPIPLQSDDPRYVDLTEVRGNEDVVDLLFESLEWADTRTSQLITGHRGCGKSTELLRLKERLERANFAVIYFEADDLLDLNDVLYSDILVAIASQLYKGLREMDVKLNQELIDQIFEWFAEVIEERTDTKALEAELASEFKLGTPNIVSPLARIMARVTGQLRTGTESKRQVRRRLDPQITQLITNINLLISEGKNKLIQRGKRDLVIIIDNLDRIPFRPLNDGHRNSHDAIYIEHGEQLCALHSHVIYTVPIAMFYSPQASILRGIFPESMVVPMIKTRTRAGEAHEPGLEALRQMLAQRVALDEVFTHDALDRLCAACGGHPRDLMILVRYACRYAAERYPRPIDENATERAIGRLVSEYSRMVAAEHLPLLLDVHRRKEIRNNETHQTLLHNLSILSYMNGAPPWYDVHPIVLRLPKFRALLEDGS